MATDMPAFANDLLRTAASAQRSAAAYEMAREEEYEQAAAWCAERGIAGNLGDPLPSPLAAEVCEAIAADLEAFKECVRRHAYARAMDSLGLPEDPDEPADAGVIPYSGCPCGDAFCGGCQGTDEVYAKGDAGADQAAPPAWVKNFSEAREHDEPFDGGEHDDCVDEVAR